MNISTQFKKNNPINELVINWHITEVCNYSCQYCFAKWGKPNELHRDDANVNLLLSNLANYFLSDRSKLRQSLNYENVRINFAGGEPFVLGKRFLDIVQITKLAGFKTSIITNGQYLSSLKNNIPRDLFDVVGISYDSLDESICKEIGRVDRKGNYLSPIDILMLANSIRSTQTNASFKLNTVVNKLNHNENFSDFIKALSPDKWKMFQAQPFNNHELLISDKEFETFVARHNGLDVSIFDENNQEMTDSYLMIDPKGRFYQNSNGTNAYVYSGLINEVGVDKALKGINFNLSKYLHRYKPNNDFVIKSVNL